MRDLSRRRFLQTTAATTGSLVALQYFSGTWVDLAHANQTGYFEKEFDITDALCRKVLAKALSKGGDFADLYFEHTVTNWVILEDGKVNQAYGQIDLGVGIRTVKGNQVGYGFTQELTLDAMLAAAATAATIADGSAKEPAKAFVPSATKENRYPLQRLLTAVPITEKLPIVQSLNDLCFARNKAVIKVSAGLNDQQKRVMVVTSDGRKTEDLLPRNFLYASVVCEKEGRRERSWWNQGGRKDFSYYSPEIVHTIANNAVDRAVTLFDAKQPPAGEMPVVLGPGSTGILLHEAIGHGMEADFNRKKISTYCTMIDKKVAEPFVTIVDNANNVGKLGSINFDDEGNPGKDTRLVEKGILRSYLHDKISASEYGLEPTGNGRRQSYRHYPIPRMRNTYMLPGPDKAEDIIASVKKGIYVQDVSNGQVKIGEGDFAFYVSQGRMIEDGKLTAPIKDVNIIGNGPKMLANITRVADDLEIVDNGSGWCGKDGQRVPVGFGLPTVLVKSLTVGGTQG